MSDINEVRERLDAAAEQYAGPLNCQWMATDLRALLADHARLQAEAAWRRSDEPDLCEICSTREEARVDAEGIPFCDQCWNETFGSEQPSKGKGVGGG